MSQEIIDIYKKLIRFSGRVCFDRFDREEFPQWGIEKIIKNNTRAGSFRTLYIDYLRKTKADKRLKPIDFERKRRIDGDLQLVNTSRRSKDRERINTIEIELADPKACNYTRGLGYHFETFGEYNQEDYRLIKKTLKNKNVHKYLEGKTMKNIGKSLNLTESRICQIINSAKKTTKQKIERKQFLQYLNLDMEVLRWAIKTNS
jgi:hypothetical protein